MALLLLRDVDMGYGGPLLLEKANLAIERGERVCLLGRNGNGKTTLIKLIAGDLEPISGHIERQNGLKIARLSQQVPAGIKGSVYHEVTAGLGKQGELLNEYHNLTAELANNHEDSRLLARLDKLSNEIEAAGGWQVGQQVETVISRMKLEADAEFESLSAGLKRRVHLAKALVSKPDILLLDEPTNHLDIESIDWIEEFLLNSNITMLFITHDRSFLKNLATRIIEIDDGRLTSYSCDYQTYLKRKTDAVNAQIAQQEKFDKRLAQEEVWIRRGIQGRRTRNEGRVRALKAMRQERANRRAKVGNVKFQLQQAKNSGQLVAKCKDVSFFYTPDRKIISSFETTIMRGDKIGIIGPNGAGKTTLLNLILGKLKPTSGSIELGTNLEIAYFDQLHAQLDENKTVMDNVADGYTTLTIDGEPRNVIGYLQDFLFMPSRSRSLVSALSGGERNRLLLARIFAKPSNVLVLDEPTNDLDIETLELLEELISKYKGTVLMVSHDREFLNNVVTSTLAIEKDGYVKEYFGGYDDYLRQRKDTAVAEATMKEKPKPKSKPKPATPLKRKLSYKESRELEAIPAKIESLELQIAEIHEKMASSDFYKQSSEEIAKTNETLKDAQGTLDQLYKRWEELEL